MFAVRVARVVALVLLAGCSTRPQPAPSAAPPPATLEEFRAAAEQIVRETGVPGAGIALVRPGGVEWAGGVGLADRDRGVPITADTHFRVGSISKTFVAIALVQQYEDDALDL
jgi:D-alanyl-D-alanine carboxypeptidase